MLSTIESVNIGRATPSAHTSAATGQTGIDKRPVTGAVQVAT